MNYEERCGLWSMSNIYLNTCLKEGFSMQLLEYVCVKQVQKKLDRATAIVSEFAGCANSLGGAVITNPYDIENISNKLEEAINMSNEQKQQRMEQTYEYVNSHTT